MLMAWRAGMNFVGIPVAWVRCFGQLRSGRRCYPRGEHHPCHDVGFSPPGHPFSCCKRHWAWKALLAKLLLSLLSPKPGPGRAQKLGQDNPKRAVGQWPSTTQVVHQ